MINLKGLELHELRELMKKQGEPFYRGTQIFSWIHQKFASDFQDMTNLGKESRLQFAQLWQIGNLGITGVRRSQDCDTVKYLFQLPDGEGVEAVLMRNERNTPTIKSEYKRMRKSVADALMRIERVAPQARLQGGERTGKSAEGDLMFFDNRLSVCVSTQAGCAYGCVFCASGQRGWTRNLETWEIVDQVLQIQKTRKDRISNIVFMGMGEPLGNYDRVLKALRIFHDPMGLGIGMRHITLSTVGLVPGIRRLADEGLPIRLAVSLHAPNDRLRETLMPVNRKYKLKELLEACRYYQSKVKRRMTFEYTLMGQVNDEPALAYQLAGLLGGLRCHVNLIPLNPIPEYPHTASPPKRVQVFRSILEEQGIPATVRQERGQDISAACGQLRRAILSRP